MTAITFFLVLRGEEVEIRGHISSGEPDIGLEASLSSWSAYDSLNEEIDFDPSLTEEEVEEIQSRAIEVYYDSDSDDIDDYGDEGDFE